MKANTYDFRPMRPERYSVLVKKDEDIDTKLYSAGHVFEITDYDPESTKLSTPDGLLGKLAVTKDSCLSNTVPGDKLEKKDVVGHMLIRSKRSNASYLFLCVSFFPKEFSLKKEDEPEEKSADIGTELAFKGTQTIYPGKKSLMFSLDHGETPPLILYLDNGTVVAKNAKGIKCGCLVDGQVIPDIFTEELEVAAIAKPLIDKTPWEGMNLSTTPFLVEIKGKAESKEPKVTVDSYMKAIRALNDSCKSLPEDTLNRINYMTACGFTQKEIMRVLSQIYQTDYATADRDYIMYPSVLFQDSVESGCAEGYVKRAVSIFFAKTGIRLVGDKGCGKNTLLDTLSWLLYIPEFKLDCNEDTSQMEIIGSKDLRSGDSVFTLSKIMHAMQIGGIALLNEGNMVYGSVMTAINSMGDDSGSTTVPEYGLVKFHPRAKLAMTMNEGYSGTKPLNSASCDRFDGLVIQNASDISKLFNKMAEDAKTAYIQELNENPFLDPEDVKAETKAMEVRLRQAVNACTNLFGRIQKTLASNSDTNLTDSAVTIRGYKAAIQKVTMVDLKTALRDSIAGRCQETEERMELIEMINLICP